MSKRKKNSAKKAHRGKRKQSSGQSASKKRKVAGSKSVGSRKAATVSRETRAADAITVAWMLSAVATLMGVLAGFGLWLALSSVAEPDPQTATLPLVLLFTAQISGVVALLLTPLTYGLRRDKPPKLIVCAVLLIVVAPWVLVLTLPAP